MASVYVDFPYMTDEQIRKEGNQIGLNIGMLLRILLDIKMLWDWLTLINFNKNLTTHKFNDFFILSVNYFVNTCFVFA